MSNLILRNKYVVTGKVPDIVKQLKMESFGRRLFKDIKDKGDHCAITCPLHADGQEKNPDCHIVTINNLKASNGKDIEYGSWHCFACGEKGSLVRLVQIALHKSKEDAEQWLIDSFCEEGTEYTDLFGDVDFFNNKTKTVINESELNKYRYYHPYMWERHLKKEVVDMCEVGYDKENDMITFPVRDEHGKLVMITKRSVKNKTFLIPKDVVKPVYLLDKNIEWGAKELLICESQINALTAIGYGMNAVALFGTGTPQQMEILNKCGINHFILAFDGDSAGDKAIERFKNNVRKDVFVSVMQIPRGKDINDLTEEEFFKLPIL